MDATNPVAPTYAKVEQHLQQGDIFRQDTVTPVLDFQKRIFRASDGRHGSVVFSEGASGRVFDETELLRVLNSCERTQLHTNPFTFTHDGHPELIIVHSTLTSYFIIVSQTCDICGVHKKALPTTIILPILTIQDICRYQRLPLQSMGDQEVTIEEFLAVNANAAHLRGEVDAFRYPELVRDVFSNWNPQKQFEQDRNKIRKYLFEMQGKGYMYFLQSDTQFRVPESYVDFSMALTVPTQKLDAVKSTRIACVADPYRLDFARKFSDRLSRIALPLPLKPQKY